MSTVERHRARLSVGAAALTAVAAVLFALGWMAGFLASSAVWIAAAVRVGWSEGRR